MIHEHSLDAAVVPVKCKMLHLMPGALPVTVVISWHILVGVLVMWSASSPHHVHEHRDVVQVEAGGIDGSPMPLHVSVLDGSWRVVEPVVVAVTRTGWDLLKRDATVLEGGVPAADRVLINPMAIVYRH